MHAAQLIEISNNISLGKSTYEALKHLPNENYSNITFTLLNINSICYKSETEFFCINNMDILFIDETKLDSLFPDTQFFIEGYSKPLPLGVSGRSRKHLVFSKSDLPTKQFIKKKKF